MVTDNISRTWPILIKLILLRSMFLEITVVGVGHIIDSQVLGNGGAIRTAVIFFYLSNEGISILENAAHLGLPIPEKLKNALEQLHGHSNEEYEER